MGWLSERIIQYLYESDNEQIIIEAPASEDPPKAPDGFKYKGFVPEKLSIMTKVQYEQNGRVAYRVDVGDGKFIHRSATREKYERTMGNTSGGNTSSVKPESVYTKAYAEKVKEKQKETMAMHNRNLKKILKGER